MTIANALLLGIIQGASEFLPISSSGHLYIAQKLLGLNDIPLLFTVLLHLGSLCAVLIFFRQQIKDLFFATFNFILRRPAVSSQEQLQRQMVFALIVATLVTAILGIFASQFIHDAPIYMVLMGFLLTAIFLIISSRISKKAQGINSDIIFEKSQKITIRQGIIIGIFQGFGVLPGISRSGATIAGGLFSKLDRKTAGEFSFLLSIPAIFGAFLLELKDIKTLNNTIGALPIALGCLAAFISGFICLVWLMKLIQKGKLEYFAFYLIPLAIVLFFVF